MAYTTIDDPSAHFQCELYTGNSTTNAITFSGNSDMKPDLVWNKRRDAAYNHVLWDSTRGVTKYIASNTSSAEATFGYVSSFDTDGVTFGTADQAVNTNGGSYVLWNWKANGGTTASNSDGDITSTVQANTTAGFSIVTYAGNGSQDQTIGHGLGAVPKMILFKNRSNSAYWYVYHIGTGNDTMMYLNLSNAAQSLSSQFSTPTTTTFNVSNENSTFNGYNTNTDNYVAYVFAEVQGYSKFSSYIGNGNADGPFVYTGFKPAFIMLKRTNGSDGWFLLDAKRNPTNISTNSTIRGDESGAEGSASKLLDMLSNGFKLRGADGAYNGGDNPYIFMAFAENPFVTSTGIPTTAF